MTSASRLPKLTFWRAVFLVLMAAGAYATYLRFVHGLGAATNLSDKFPWGLWIGFDVLCGVGLAAGGFTLAATVHIFNLKRYEPVVRPAILTAFLGYLLVVVALLFDLGRPYRIWHPLVMWNPHSVMFEVGWCVTLYTTVLSLEFAPVVLEKLKWHVPLRLLRAIMIPLVIAGVLLSTLHQSSLGSLYLILPHKLHPLWYSPLLPIQFFFSAVMVGLAMTIFESWQSSKSFGRQLEMPLLQNLARVLAVLLAAFVVMRFLDLARRGALHYLFEPGTERYFFFLETALFVVPMILLFQSRVRASSRALYLTAGGAIFGFVTHRLNVSVTGMGAGSGTSYVPKWTEVAITLSIVAAGFAVFYLAGKYLPVFEESGESGAESRAGVAETAMAENA
jgi:Ni/Fe-hydrogenase subunit HybB-like protein